MKIVITNDFGDQLQELHIESELLTAASERAALTAEIYRAVRRAMEADLSAAAAEVMTVCEYVELMSDVAEAA